MKGKKRVVHRIRMACRRISFRHSQLRKDLFGSRQSAFVVRAAQPAAAGSAAGRRPEQLGSARPRPATLRRRSALPPPFYLLPPALADSTRPATMLVSAIRGASQSGPARCGSCTVVKQASSAHASPDRRRPRAPSLFLPRLAGRSARSSSMAVSLSPHANHLTPGDANLCSCPARLGVAQADVSARKARERQGQPGAWTHDKVLDGAALASNARWKTASGESSFCLAAEFWLSLAARRRPRNVTSIETWLREAISQGSPVLKARRDGRPDRQGPSW